jgi:hypothetical protein
MLVPRMPSLIFGHTVQMFVCYIKSVIPITEIILWLPQDCTLDALANVFYVFDGRVFSHMHYAVNSCSYCCVVCKVVIVFPSVASLAFA